MERKRSNIETVVVTVVVVMAVMVSVRRVMSHAPPGVCIDRCLKECKGSGLGAASCVKYCPVHCLPPDTSKDHYCNLGCMLDQCAKYITDDKKMTDCVLKCRKYHCNIRAKTKIVA